MKITLNRVNDNFHFELKNERGHLVNVDSRPEYGGNDMGASPMELVLMGVAGCSAIDMIKNSIGIPIFGLGGIRSGNLYDVMAAGAYGIAMISAILPADDIQKAAEDMNRRIGETVKGWGSV